MYDFTGFQRDLLYAIAGQEELHGFAIKTELEDYYETETHHGRLYPNLDDLVDKGLVEKGRSIGGPTPTRSPSAAAARSRPVGSRKISTWLLRSESTDSSYQRQQAADDPETNLPTAATVDS